MTVRDHLAWLVSPRHTGVACCGGREALRRDTTFGVYGSTVEPGQVAVGGPVELDR
jgi:hypothetical protein